MFAIHEYLPYFQQVRTVVTGNPSTVYPLCLANPDRALLVITCEQTQLVFLGLSPNLQNTTPDFVFQGPDTIRLSWWFDGPMPAMAWWGMVGGASSPISIVVNEWIWTPPSDPLP